MLLCLRRSRAGGILEDLQHFFFDDVKNKGWASSAPHENPTATAADSDRRGSTTDCDEPLFALGNRHQTWDCWMVWVLTAHGFFGLVVFGASRESSLKGKGVIRYGEDVLNTYHDTKISQDIWWLVGSNIQ